MDDANGLIYLANQIGLIDEGLRRMTPNASKCLTRGAVEETNISLSREMRVLRIEDIYGMLVILSIGLGGALLVCVTEGVVYKISSKKEEGIQWGSRVRSERENKLQGGRIGRAFLTKE